MCSSHACLFGKHPRFRGEDAKTTESGCWTLETPPLARGRRISGFGKRRQLRNTPACAGKTIRVSSNDETDEKHPRLRGEDSMPSVDFTDCSETPPLARGRLFISLDGLDDLRNTPACAGKTKLFLLHEPHKRKHPRLRGEDWLFQSVQPMPEETPPLARGRLRDHDADRIRAGNTPACAGKTGNLAAYGVVGEKHPRLRGEDVDAPKLLARSRETPPLARGRRRSRVGDRRAVGNTPACAGKTI